MSRVEILRVVGRGLSCALLMGATALQGQGSLSVSSRSFHDLVPRGVLITASMCQPEDHFCQTHAVGKPLFQTINAVAADTHGNIYALDDTNGILVKVTPSGVPTIIAGQFQMNTAAQNFPLAATSLGLGDNVSPSGPVGPMTVDSRGNIYLAEMEYSPTLYSPYSPGGLIRIDPLGIATMLTNNSIPVPQAVDGAPASTQSIQPGALTTDAAGNVYVTDYATCTLRELVVATGVLRVVAGNLTNRCTLGDSGDPTPGEAAVGYNLGGLGGVAIGRDGTIYLADSGSLFSITKDGVIHLIATTQTFPFLLGGPHPVTLHLPLLTEGPLSTSGSIGSAGDLFLDGAANLYYNGYGYLGNLDPQGTSGIVELQRDGNGAANQLLALTGGLLTTPASASAPFGQPSTLTYPGPFAMDSLGRVIVANTYRTSSAFLQELDYLGRDGSLIFDTNRGVSTQLVTLTNSGAQPLFFWPGFAYAVAPSSTDLKVAGQTGAPPFSVNLSEGTCAPFLTGGGGSLAPGASCTLEIDYKPNTGSGTAGAVTLYTSDPLGPLTITLSATPLILTFPGTAPPGYPAEFSASSVELRPETAISANGSFTVHVSVQTAVPGLAGNIAGIPGAVSTPPVGLVNLKVTNLQTGVFFNEQAAIDPSTGIATLSMSKLFPYGTYQFQAYYEGGGATVPAYSPVKIVSVQPQEAQIYAWPLVQPTYTYEGATAQFLNFTGTVQGQTELLSEDLLAGNTGSSFELFDSNGHPVSTSSTTPLSVGDYVVKPTVTNAAALNYTADLAPASFYIAPAPITLTAGNETVTYGEELNTGPTNPPNSINLPAVQVSNPSTFFAADQASGAIQVVPQFWGPTTPNTSLPVGTYTVHPVLTGSGAGNYKVTSVNGSITVTPALLTVKLKNVTAAAGTRFLFSQMCVVCAVGTTGTQLTYDFTNLGIKLVGPNLSKTIYFEADQPSTGLQTALTLPKGTYTVTPVLIGPSNYKLVSTPAVLTLK